jgi:predicted aldo/keto reductase-like oxidoreductase
MVRSTCRPPSSSSEGRCRFVGFTTHATTAVIHETIRGGEFDYINLHWYFVNDLNWSCIEAAAQKDMGVFIISPNDKGRETL